MADVVLTCSVCGKANVFPRIHQNILTKEGAMTYCASCNTITQQKITSQVPRQVTRGDALQSVSHQPVQPMPLQDRLLAKLRANNLTLDDIRRCDAKAKGQLLQSFGFSAQEQLQLQGFVDPPPSVSPPKVATTPPRESGSRGAPDMSSPSNLGIAVAGEHVVAHCSVFPSLPAEYWCCACNVLVSSRCHVQGIHKDHPFVTLRVAAEAHVKDLHGWSDRCRAQLSVLNSICNNLKHAESLTSQSLGHQQDALAQTFAQVQEDLNRWKEQLAADITAQVNAQVASIQLSSRRSQELHDLYATHLAEVEPLVANIPPLDQSDKNGDEWSLRVLDQVSRLRQLHAEPIPIPKLTIPQVQNNCTPSSFMQLIKAVTVPVGVRLPDLVDPGYFNFPNPAASARVAFSLVPPGDGAVRGVLLYNGRTLTRSADVVPSHAVVTGSQVFYSGSSSWEVHIDRIGQGPGRVLAGVIVAGTDGEGIVWDGNRIVGPNEGECRIIDEKLIWRAGTILRFTLDLDPPAYLTCFFNREAVARIPVPPQQYGWVPAFSVFGSQDQITVTPTLTNAVPSQAAPERVKTAKNEEDPHKQEEMIASLQRQLDVVTTQLESQQRSQQLGQEQQPQQQPYLPPPFPPKYEEAPKVISQQQAPYTANISPNAQRRIGEAYSPELKQLMRYVDELH